jgi:general L-amino acid transport system permease protein
MAEQAQTHEPGSHPDLPAPILAAGPIKWVRDNLFSSPLNIALTLGVILLLGVLIPPALNWFFLDAVFDAGSRNECRELGTGACWAIIVVRFSQFLYGFYPEALRWRVDLAFVLLFVALVPILYDKTPFRRFAIIFTCVYPVIAFFLLWGGGTALEPPGHEGDLCRVHRVHPRRAADHLALRGLHAAELLPAAGHEL